MRLLTWIIVLPLALLFIAFAVANRGSVTVSFDPLPYGVDLPVFFLIFVAIFIGLLVGSFATWRANRSWRRAARENYRKAVQLGAEVEGLKTEIARRDAASSGEANDGRTQTLIDAA